jgi:hypothetical protein
MRNFRIVVALFLGVLSTTAVAQRALVPIVDYKDISVATSSGKPLTVEQVKDQIVAAGKKLNWDMAFTANNDVVGTLNVRNKHTISVDISVSPEKYSIKYRGSHNMKYRATPDRVDVPDGPVIHPAYNQWVQTLNSEIQAELRKL